VHYVIRGALERAVRWRHLGVNKAALAAAPSPNPTEPDPPSAEEAATLLSEAWRDPEWGLVLWLTMITGSRRGEVSALRWRHVDLGRAALWVQRSNAQTRSGVKEKETKTRQRRRVALDPHTVSLLAEHRQRWENRCDRTHRRRRRHPHRRRPARPRQRRRHHPEGLRRLGRPRRPPRRHHETSSRDECIVARGSRHPSPCLY
jgi:integrase